MNREFWKNKKVFVTGATGLLGSWLVKYLSGTGAEITILVRDRVPRSKIFSDGLFDRVNAVHGELEDLPLLIRAVNEYEIDTVFHVAAQAIVPTANNQPLSTFESNIKGTWNILEACRLCGAGVKRIVVASSDKAYGTQPRLPYDETMPLQGVHPYDVSKSCADLISRMYNVSYGLPVCVTRCGNFFGAGDLNFNRLIPGTIRSVLEGTPPVIRSDGTYVRDYLYIEDGAEAYLLLAEKMIELKLEGHAFNFSNELQIPVIELVRTILKVMGSALAPSVVNTVRNEIPHQYLSAKKAREVLGWKPLFTIEEGLRRTIDWYRDYLRSRA